MSLEDVLSQYNQSNFDFNKTAQYIRDLSHTAPQQVGQIGSLTEADLEGGVHKAAEWLGRFTEGSNYGSVAAHAVRAALDNKYGDGWGVGWFAQPDVQNWMGSEGTQAQARWAGTQESDDGFGDLLKIGALGLGAYGLFGGGLGLFGGLDAAAGLTEAGWGMGLGGLGTDAAGLAAASGATGAGMDLADWWAQALNPNSPFYGSTIDGVVGGNTGGSMDIGDIFSNLDDYSGGGWTSEMQSYVDMGFSPERAAELSRTFGTPGMGDILEQTGAVTSYEGGPFDFLKKLPSGIGQLLKGLLGGDGGGLLGSGRGGSGTGGTDFGKIAGGLLGYGMQDKLADKSFRFADQFAEKYGNRKEQLEWMPVARQMRDDPNGYMQSHFAPFISGFAGDAAAKASMQGQNNSGTMVNQVTKNVTDRSGNLFDSIYGKNLSAAGLMSPSAATGTAGDLTKTGLNMEDKANSNLGFAAREATSGLLGGSRGSTDEMFNKIMKNFFA